MTARARHLRTPAGKRSAVVLPPSRAQEHRKGMIAKIHLAVKQMDMEDADYRDLLLRITGRDTCGALNLVQLEAVLREFERLGWKPVVKRQTKPWVGRIVSLWKQIEPLLDEGTSRSLDGFVLRQTRTKANPEGIAKAEWLDQKQSVPVIEGLKGWLDRLQKKAVTP